MAMALIAFIYFDSQPIPLRRECPIPNPRDPQSRLAVSQVAPPREFGRIEGVAGSYGLASGLVPAVVGRMSAGVRLHRWQ